MLCLGKIPDMLLAVCVCKGRLGLGHVCSYLSKIDWADNFPLDIVEIKLQGLIRELKHFQYVFTHFQPFRLVADMHLAVLMPIQLTLVGRLFPHRPLRFISSPISWTIMLHFPFKLQTNGSSGAPRRSTDLNVTQHKTASHPIFSQIEEELHDARRVHSHGQEEDLRSALMMVIDRVSELVESFSCYFSIDTFKRSLSILLFSSLPY